MTSAGLLNTKMPGEDLLAPYAQVRVKSPDDGVLILFIHLSTMKL